MLHVSLTFPIHLQLELLTQLPILLFIVTIYFISFNPLAAGSNYIIVFLLAHYISAFKQFKDKM